MRRILLKIRDAVSETGNTGIGGHVVRVNCQIISWNPDVTYFQKLGLPAYLSFLDELILEVPA